MKELYRSAFNKDTLISSATVALSAGIFQKLGEYKVQAGELVTIGYGAESGQDQAQGRCFMKMQDSTPALMPGVVRLTAYTAQDRPIEILGEWRTETLNTDATNRTLQIPFPEHGLYVSEDKKIAIEFKPDAAGTFNKGNSTILFDVTKSVA